MGDLPEILMEICLYGEKQENVRSARRRTCRIRRELPYICDSNRGRRDAFNLQSFVMISDNPDWIFVHVQKTGGDAVRTALGLDRADARKHFLARELRDLYGQAVWDSCFKFAFVRNPWDRLVSWWSMIDNARELVNPLHSPNHFFHYVLERAHSFEEFLSRCTDEIVDTDGRKHIFRNQIDYLVDENGAVIVDFIGRFERLQEGFNQVAARLGQTASELPRTNTSRHAQYTEYYTSAMVEDVGRLYARDIEAFGYRFGQ
jgi:hypothetical protein